MHEYLKEFVDDLKIVIQEGLYFDEKHYKIVPPKAFICDAPARSYLKCIKGHTGYNACERCVQTGVYVSGRMTYPDMTSELRTDSQFEQMVDEGHHTGVFPLNNLGIGLVTSFVLDYMHLVCLGVVRKLIYLWIKGPLRCRVSGRVLSVISQQMTLLRMHVPKTFSRKPRSLHEVAMWKATEFRLFLLYTGPIVLCKNVPRNIYQHFMILSVAMRILSPDLCSEFSQYADQLLKVFVENFAKLYGPEFIVYNVHSLIHLAQDARKYGPLDQISCFPFESFLGKIKKIVQKPQHPVQQVVKRIHEKQKIKPKRQKNNTLNQHKILHLSGPVPHGFETCKQYKHYDGKNMFISRETDDNCFDLNGQVGLVKNILYSSSGDTYLV